MGYSHVFSVDVRDEKLTHMAITIDGLTVSLYLNGKLVEQATLTVLPPEITEGFFVGNDRRPASGQYFKGTVYSVTLFDDVRSAEEIAEDALLVRKDAQGILYSYYYKKEN